MQTEREMEDVDMAYSDSFWEFVLALMCKGQCVRGRLQLAEWPRKLRERTSLQGGRRGRAFEDQLQPLKSSGWGGVGARPPG
jgi:hypothetical protein